MSRREGDAQMAGTDRQQQYEALKRQLLALGPVRPGSLLHRFMRCGKPSCRCKAEPPVLHGPYYQWTWKVRGKTVSRWLTAAQAARCEEWVRNHRLLRMLVRKMEAWSVKETDRILRELSAEPEDHRP
jgi:Family of unknown function (DUF6788)